MQTTTASCRRSLSRAAAWFATAALAPAATRGPAEIRSAGDVLFTSTIGFGVLAIDYSDPAQPKELDHVLTSGELRGMKLLGDRLFAFGMALYSLRVFPAAEACLEGIGWGKTRWFGGALWGNTNRRIVVMNSIHGGFQAFDVSDPSMPRLVPPPHPQANHAVWIGDRIFAAEGKHLAVYDTSGAEAVALGRIDLGIKGPVGSAVHRNLVYVAPDGQPLSIVDVAHPAEPRL